MARLTPPWIWRLLDRTDWDMIRRLAPRIAFGFVVGGCGALLAHWAHVPLAFMLGSLFACMAASVVGLPVDIPLRFRTAFIFLIGLFLGQSFTPDAASRMLAWPISMGLALLYVPVGTVLAFLFYERVAKLDRLTAIFASVPGGLSAVVLFSGALGGDERHVALSQSLRIAIVVVTAPFVAFGLFGYSEPHVLDLGRPLLSFGEFAAMAAVGLVLYAVMTRMGAPLAFMVAPLLASAGLRLAGVVEGVLPEWMVELSLVVVGGAIGCRFRGVELLTLLRLAFWTVGGTIILMATAAVFAVIAALIAPGVDITAALLAYAPGGVAEMCLIALALDADPGFVAAHHIARIMFIIFATPFLASFVTRLGAARPRGKPAE